MDNLARLQMEVKGIKLEVEELTVYLLENDLVCTDTYDATSKTNLKNIYRTALAILEGIANDPTNFKNYKLDGDISVSMFSRNLNDRIDYLNRKIRLMPDDNEEFGSDGGATVGYLFTE